MNFAGPLQVPYFACPQGLAWGWVNSPRFVPNEDSAWMFFLCFSPGGLFAEHSYPAPPSTGGLVALGNKDRELCCQGASSLVHGGRCVFSLWEDCSRAPQSLWAGISVAAGVQTCPLREDLGHPYLPALHGQLPGKLQAAWGIHHSNSQLSSQSCSAHLLGRESWGCGGRNSPC